MAFQLKASNALDQLARELCLQLKTTSVDAFQPFYIITQTEGVNNWLKFQMADRLGIAANFYYLKPNELINTIYYVLGGTYSTTLTVDHLTWLLYKLLGEQSFIDQYKEIASYYTNFDTALGTVYDGVKRLALAQKVADLFDHYMIYRSDMIQEWNEDLPDALTDNWQRDLWRKARKIAKETFPDKIQVGKEIQLALKDPDKVQKLKNKMPNLYFFGISLLTDYHLQIFQQLARHLTLSFYILNPAPEVYWFDDKSERQLAFLKKLGKIDQSENAIGNPLLLSWGKIIQDTFGMLFKEEEMINSYEEVAVIEPPQDSLLHKIQHAIFLNESQDNESIFDQQDLDDGSITINACYSPIREVEVLYNYLVHLVDRQSDVFSPRDMVVMVSDINLYAAYIKAVFNHAPYKFPFTIADESFVSADSISNALVAILSLVEDAFSAEAVVRLLDSSYICKRLQLSDIAFIRQVLDQANIRSGMQGNSTDDSMYISWEYGLQRIMYGICMSDSEMYGSGVDSFVPLDLIEGGAALEIIRFVHFVQQLMEAIKDRRIDRSLSDWVLSTEALLNDFICGEDDIVEEDYLFLMQQLENYNSANVLFTENVSYEVFANNFLEKIGHGTHDNSFAVGGITFCSLIPMRSIPFKVVALLGLNFDKFPRKEHPLGFDLMEDNKRKGDRNIKENDKHLFLETLLSAKQYLYISYVGQSIKDNSRIPPSTLVDELLEYIATFSKDPNKVRRDFITRQPLHGYSQQYNNEDPKLYSYLLNGIQGVGTGLEILRPVDKEQRCKDISEVTIEALVGFFKNPVKGYYQDVLSIFYQDQEAVLSETELFELDHLQKWQLRNQLLPIKEEEQRFILKERLLKTGALPLKNMATLNIQQEEETVAPVRGLFESASKGSFPTTLSVDITLGEARLTGEIPHIYGDQFIFISWSKNEMKYLLAAYIQYLALAASGAKVTACFISKIKGAVYNGTSIAQQEAIARLSVLLHLYKTGHVKIWPFTPDFSIKPADIDKLDNKSWNKALKDFFNNYKSPNKDPYLNKEYQNELFDQAHSLADYQTIAMTLLFPLGDVFPEYFDK